MARLDQATVCHEAIVWNHYKGASLDPAQAARRVRHLRDPARATTLRELDAAVSRSALDAAEVELRRFVADPSSGLEACLAGLTGGDRSRRAPGLALRRFADVEACISLQQRIHPEPWRLLEEFCLPELL